MDLQTGGTSQFLVRKDGRVGIGSTTPAVKFVISNANAEGYEINPTGGVGGGATVATYNRTTSAYTTLTTYSSAMTWYSGSAGTTRAIDLIANGNVGIANTSPPNKLFITGDIGLDGISVRDTATATTTATTQITLFEYAVGTYDSCDVIVKAVSGGERHITRLLVTANSSVAIATEYSTLLTGSSLFSVEVDVTGANTRLRITPATTTSTVFKSSYELITQ
jgi:hypothetical protein